MPAVALPPLASDGADARWVAGRVRCWLDEEWTPLEAHRELGAAAGAAYAAVRRGGAADMGDLVLGLAERLLGFDYSDTFVNAFDVANKCAREREECVGGRGGQRCGVCAVLHGRADAAALLR